MIKLTNGNLVLSASDLTAYLACPHLTQQKLAVTRGERGKLPRLEDPHGELIKTRGFAHEETELAKLIEAAGGDHINLADNSDDAWTGEGLQRQAERTEAAMRAGTALISQATLFDGEWQGRADVLRRVPVPSDLGDYSYEVLDMKLSRQVKPHFVHQLALYSRLLEQVQGVLPQSAWVILGDGTQSEIDLGRYLAINRRVCAALQQLCASDPVVTYPEPVAHCEICDLAAECRARRLADDHLSLVARASRDQRTKLESSDLLTLEQLATAPADHDRGDLTQERFGILHGQAAIQLKSRVSGEPEHQHLEPVPGRGYVLLPEPNPADVFFDLEGDPYTDNDGGIEYLWGWSGPDDQYECLWAHDRKEEKQVFDKFVRLIHARWQENPGMHVFHYAPHEVSKLRSLATQYATCEDLVDDLLRGNVMVDLYAVVSQAMQVGEEGYSLKKLERHHQFVREEMSVREGGGSIIAYETWLETGDQQFLDSIRAYNCEDCVSTRSLRDWLISTTRPEAVELYGEEALVAVEDPDPHDTPPWVAEVAPLIAQLVDGLPELAEDDDPDQAERRLLSNLLVYHYRESKPGWWRFYDLRGIDPPDLIDEREAVYGLVRDTSAAPVPEKQSLLYRFTFPPQEFRLKAGRKATDPLTGEEHNVFAIGDHWLEIKTQKDKDEPAPVALFDGKPIPTNALRAALVEIAKDLVAGGSGFAAAHSLLRSEAPNLQSGELGESEEQLIGAILGLIDSHLAVQGPPGTGKTYQGARMIVAALDAGKRVAVTGPTHSAIKNLLVEVEKWASESGKLEEWASESKKPIVGVYKGDEAGDAYKSPHGMIEEVTANEEADDDRFQLVAGTVWLHSRPEWLARSDLLFVDEAGQMALASAVAASTCANSVVLLGDPQQLPQVSQASHPDSSGDSVLEYQLAGRPTIDPKNGVLLSVSRRMHPDVCAFVSERSYEGLLHSRAECAQRTVTASGPLTGSGLRFVEVPHEGRSQSSPEEASAIAAMCRELLAGEPTVTDDEGKTRPLTADDILVVAPYNLAVDAIRKAVPAGVRVGTVDKFQGKEAPVVFFAMTSSSGEDVPRGLDFLFNQNRLNVAISRAQCLAVLVACPRLLDADCKTLEAMELVNGACRFVEMAGEKLLPITSR